MRDRPTQLIQRPEPAPEKPLGRVSPWTMVAAGIGGLVVGLIIGTVFQVTQDDETPAVDPIAAVAPVTSDPASTTAPPPPTTSPDVVTASAPLDELVPDLTGTLLAFAPGAQQSLTWPAEEDRASVAPAPPGTLWMSWDASGNWAASLSRAAGGSSLYVGGVDEPLRPAYIPAAGFHWHPTDPGRIAWLGDTGDGWALHEGIIDAQGFVTSHLIPTDLDPAAGEALLAWGDWGFAAVRRAGAEPVLEVTRPDGSTATASAWLVTASADGQFVLRSFETGEFLRSDASLAVLEPLDWGDGEVMLWSHEGDVLAGVVETSFGAAMRIATAGGSTATFLDADEAIVMAWTPDDRFVVAWTPASRIRVVGDEEPVTGPALIFVDTADRTVHAVPAPILQSVDVRP